MRRRKPPQAKACFEVERNNKLPVTFYHGEGVPCSHRAGPGAAQAESAATEAWGVDWTAIQRQSQVRGGGMGARLGKGREEKARATNGGAGSPATGAMGAEAFSHGHYVLYLRGCI